MPALSLVTPGVFVREGEAGLPRVPRAGVAGFVGEAQRGPLNYPQAIGSWGELVDLFGGFTGYSYLAYAVFAFFTNGGERCRVVCVAHETAVKASLDLSDQTGESSIHVEAINEGTWGRSVIVAIDERSTNGIPLTEAGTDAAKGHTTVRLRSDTN